MKNVAALFLGISLAYIFGRSLLVPVFIVLGAMFWWAVLEACYRIVKGALS